MNKKSKVFLATLAGVLGASLVACGTTPSSSTSVSQSSTANSSASQSVGLTVVDFPVDETKVDSADVGSEYTVKVIVVKASDGKYYPTTVKATYSDGNEAAVTDKKFICAKIGTYTVTYTVVLDGVSTSKSYHVDVIDVTGPAIVCDLKSDNITMVGSTYDLAKIIATDNSGESITPHIEVELNGSKINLEGSVLTFSEKGTYNIKVSAQDSSKNAIDEEYHVYTKMDYESGKYFNNNWYPTEISDAVAKTGTHSYKFGMFSKATQWFNDFSMLGDVALYEATSAKYISFWIYFDAKSVGLANASYIQNARYNEQKVYDQYGNKVELDWQGKISMKSESWYRFVIDMNKYEMWGDTKDHADAEQQGITTTLRTFCFYLNCWDNIKGTNAAIESKVYLDDVRLLGETDDEVYDTKPADPYVMPANCVADFETAEQMNNFGTTSWQASTNYETETTYNGSKGAASFTPSIEWSSFIFKNTALTYNAIAGFDKVTLKTYIKDTSATNHYDDTTFFTIDAKFGDQGATIFTKTITSANEWVDLEINVKDHQTSNVSDLVFVVYKTINGKHVGLSQTVEYGNSVNVIVDDVYLAKDGTPAEYKPGETTENSTYESIFAKQLDGLTYDTTYGKSSMFTGSMENQIAMKLINAAPYQLGLEGKNNEGTDTFGEGWRCFYGPSGAFGYKFVATEHCFIKVVKQEIQAGWVEGKTSWGIVDLQGTLSVLHNDYMTGGETGTGDFVELLAGEAFLYQLSHTEQRNVQNPPMFVTANAVAA